MCRIRRENRRSAAIRAHSITIHPIHAPVSYVLRTVDVDTHYCTVSIYLADATSVRATRQLTRTLCLVASYWSPYQAWCQGLDR
jgi:hypothetical protein